ncbi:hypothetical protein JOD54_003639 [Actinokineospora baliensis]|uniref:NACHT domain-containing protein n=1 Tax=Actinokineospora baliensis TaxID=547056 RepID=UPI00195BED78|nr:ATP-binding protein [Actinokineospora baliensis]MBM7773435.1 hypothetical protein [Actinokineospora baliensis]
MPRNPPITFQGALKVLGHHDRPWLDRLDSLLGGVILASVGIAPIEGLWALVDQKNEAVRLVRTGLDAVSDKLLGTNGVERQDLLVASHTILIMTAYFEVVDEQRKIPHRDRVVLATGVALNEKNWLKLLYTNPLPAPCATKTFATLLTDISGWASLMIASAGIAESANALGDEIASRYHAHFLRMAERIPEFRIWAELAERAAVGSILGRLSEQLAHGPANPPRDLRKTLADANTAELDEPLVRADGAATVFPRVREIFQTPRVRLTTRDSRSLLADENWWDEEGVRVDLDRVLAVHFSTPAATERPMLLLGHPGAGKSLLTKVLAASLPAANYTVVRVPLRHVDANAQVDSQIQTALDRLTHRRVSWPDLAEQTSGTLRVVLLDGLDELLQATTHDRTGYLHDVETFQRREAAYGYPVAVVVTSRTLVVDRVTVPDGVPVVKLEDFDTEQVEAWKAEWNHANEHSGVRLLPSRLAENVAELARQPLLLMMLAVYYADWEAPEPTAQMSLTDLYERMFELFARREAEKRAIADVDATVRLTLRRLSVAALGMLNRGAQSITEADLAADLTALDEPVTSGKRLLAEFFFVHSPQARGDTEHRAYEFLHLTFGEYLVADRVVEVLRDVADSAFGRRAKHRPDDDLLFTLLSHQPLSIQRPVLDFIAAKLAKLPPDETEKIAETLEELLARYHEPRTASRFDKYRPLPDHSVRQTAAFSVNLVLLRIACPQGDLDLAAMRLVDKDRWRSLVRLWYAGLDSTALLSIGASMDVRDDRVRSGGTGLLPLGLTVARLLGDRDLQARLLIGHAVQGRYVYHEPADYQEWLDQTYAWLVGFAARPTGGMFGFTYPPEPYDPTRLSTVIDLATHVLRIRSLEWHPHFLAEFLVWLADLPGDRRWLVDIVALHGAAARRALVEEIRSTPTSRLLIEELAQLEWDAPA